MSAAITRTSVAVCIAIIELTITGKVYGLIHGGGLLAQPHPFLWGTYKVYVWLGLIAETLSLVVLAILGVRAFLTACMGLAVVFISYHAVGVGMQISGPCPCLGGILSHWKPLTQAEATLSFVLASVLGVFSFLGLFSASRTPKSPPPPQLAGVSSSVAMTLWLTAGVFGVWLWAGTVLGGDEGMEGAKSLQLMVHPEGLSLMWNDQPALLSIIVAHLFRLFGPSFSTGRMAVVLLGLALPLTLAVYYARIGIKWAVVIFIIFLWLAMPFYFASLLLEAPAYCIGITALLPLIMRGYGRLPLFFSVLLATLALSIKLTAAFALVVPFVWLMQRSRNRAFIWGILILGLTFLNSLIQPGWSWSSMSKSHLDFASPHIQEYGFHSLLYAQGWLVCLFAIFAISFRYVNNNSQQILPWCVAAAVALFIHLIHRPFWYYYGIHLMTPVAVLGGVGAADFWQTLRTARLQKRHRRFVAIGTLLVCLLWVWQQGTQMFEFHAQADPISASPITEQLKALGDSGHTEFAINPVWTFAAGQTQTPPELTIVPLKRFWSGQINDAIITQKLASNHVDALVIYPSTVNESSWSNLLLDYVPTAREASEGGEILFVRRELMPHAIRLDSQPNTQAQVLRKLGL